MIGKVSLRCPTEGASIVYQTKERGWLGSTGSCTQNRCPNRLVRFELRRVGWDIRDSEIVQLAATTVNTNAAIYGQTSRHSLALTLSPPSKIFGYFYSCSSTSRGIASFGVRSGRRRTRRCPEFWVR